MAVQGAAIVRHSPEMALSPFREASQFEATLQRIDPSPVPGMWVASSRALGRRRWALRVDAGEGGVFSSKTDDEGGLLDEGESMIACRSTCWAAMSAISFSERPDGEAPCALG